MLNLTDANYCDNKSYEFTYVKHQNIDLEIANKRCM